MQKNIFVVINRGMIIRHLFRVVRLMLAKGDFRFIFFVPEMTPSMVDEEWKNEITQGLVSFVRIKDVHHSYFRSKIFNFFLRLSLVNRTSFLASWYGSGKAEPKNRTLYLLAFPILLLMHYLVFTRSLLQKIELILYPDSEFDHFFLEYRPALVLTNSMFSKNDIAFMKAANRFKTGNVNLVKGWDQYDKWRLHVMPRVLLAPNAAVKGYALRYNGFEDDSVKIVGFLPFDWYREDKVCLSREELCRRRGLDPARRILFFGSEGPWSPNDDEVVGKLIEAIKMNRFSRPCSLIIRPHFGSVKDNHFKKFAEEGLVYVDDRHRLVEGFPDKWYPTDEELVELSSSFAHTDVMVCFRSTLSLDAIAFDKPVINITTGGFIKNGRIDATALLYEQIFYRDMLAMGAVTLAAAGEPLYEAIDRALRHPEYEREERKLVRENYIPNLSSKNTSAEMIAEHLIACIIPSHG